MDSDVVFLSAAAAENSTPLFFFDSQVGIAESIVTYTRKDGSFFTIKACTVLRRRDGKAADIRIHADLMGL